MMHYRVLGLVLLIIEYTDSLIPNMMNMFSKSDGKASGAKILSSDGIPSWEELNTKLMSFEKPKLLKSQEELRATGAGHPHTDAKIRLFGTSGEPRVIFYRDTAAWFV
jgi:glutathione S-transferase